MGPFCPELSKTSDSQEEGGCQHRAHCLCTELRPRELLLSVRVVGTLWTSKFTDAIRQVGPQ